MGHEGVQIAQWLNQAGITALILDYRHRGKGYGHPAPMLDGQRAVRWARAEADRLQIAQRRIGVLGFSAGGHLASTLATHFDNGDPAAEDPIDRVGCRPDFAILCYPVIGLGQPFTHEGSQRNLLGPDPPTELIEQLSNEKQVTAHTPPTFLFHTTEDRAVKVENSLRFFQALTQHDIPAELHVFQQGTHGVGLAKGLPGVQHWPQLCLDWLQRLGVLAGNPVP
jgi:acetyl esterase/lipase